MEIPEGGKTGVELVLLGEDERGRIIAGIFVEESGYRPRAATLAPMRHTAIDQKESLAPSCTNRGGAVATNSPGAVAWSVTGPW